MNGTIKFSEKTGFSGKIKNFINAGIGIADKVNSVVFFSNGINFNNEIKYQSVSDGKRNMSKDLCFFSLDFKKAVEEAKNQQW